MCCHSSFKWPAIAPLPFYDSTSNCSVSTCLCGRRHIPQPGGMKYIPGRGRNNGTRPVSGCRYASKLTFILTEKPGYAEVPKCRIQETILSSWFSSNCCSVQSITTMYGCVCTLGRVSQQVQTDVESGCTNSHPEDLNQKQLLPSYRNYLKQKFNSCLHENN